MTAPPPARNKAAARRVRPPILAHPAARWVWLAVAVMAAHGVVLWAVADKRFLPGGMEFGTPAPPPMNFTARERKVIDPKTGRETAVIREFNVSTHLAAPAPPSGASSSR